MKIAVIGPVPPFRSGVAKHTGEVAKALARHGDVRTISFARQYPKALFPGADDRDETTADAAPPNTQYCLDTLSPISWRRAADDLADWGADLIVMPVWTFFTAPCLTYIARRLAARGARIIGVVHNAFDHEAASWKQALSSWQLKACDGYVTHTAILAREVATQAPERPIAVSPHPLFAYPEPQTVLPRRARLEVLMFGLIRPYKGADILVSALDELDHIDVQASIVGEVWGDGAALEAQIAASPARAKIDYQPNYVSDLDAANLFQRADLVVLPYRHVTGSGVVPLALHYDRAVIVSDLPGFRDQIMSGKTGWLVPPESPHALAHCLAERAQRGDAHTLRPGLAAGRAARSWSNFAATIVSVMNRGNTAQMPLPRHKVMGGSLT